jgi:hypothetical protein
MTSMHNILIKVKRKSWMMISKKEEAKHTSGFQIQILATYFF